MRDIVLFSYHISLTEVILLGILCLFAIIQFIYYIFIYSRMAFRKSKIRNTSNHPISVIVCARNEASNLKENLPAVLEQDYPLFEVIVVNDGSQDDTDEVLYELSKKYKNLRTTSLVDDKKFSHGKKLALNVGIKAAKNEWLVFIDADCFPVSDKWLQEVSTQQASDVSIVLGYGGYQEEKGFLNKWIRADAFFIALNYISFALGRNPYMGVGRNLSYRRSLYFKSDGFANHVHLLSGDDDLFVNENATKKNTAVIYTPNSVTRSIPKNTFSAWFRQKRRHLSTSPNYKGRHKFLLLLEPLSRMGIYGLLVAIALIGHEISWIGAGSLFLLRLIMQAVVFKIGQKRLNERDLFLTSLLNDIALPAIIFIAFLGNRFTDTKNRWI